ncbi:hypothetical protein QZH41_009760 [Actinostola sp. cb2023]|nr:hypothetical protein QZH41_009760 [Actinostola sp. cb2023]
MQRVDRYLHLFRTWLSERKNLQDLSL